MPSLWPPGRYVRMHMNHNTGTEVPGFSTPESRFRFFSGGKKKDGSATWQRRTGPPRVRVATWAMCDGSPRWQRGQRVTGPRMWQRGNVRQVPPGGNVATWNESPRGWQRATSSPGPQSVGNVTSGGAGPHREDGKISDRPFGVRKEGPALQPGERRRPIS